MPHFPVVVDVDLTPIEDRLDAIEAAGPDVIGGLVMCLQEKRAKDMQLLNAYNDGDQIVNAEGAIVIWTPAIRAEIEAELAETNRIITALS